MLQQTVRTVIRRISQNGKRYSSYHGGASDFKKAHMNELPIPQGSWQKYYDQKQKTYNMQLAVGLTILAATVGYIVQSDYIFFNAFPPKLTQEDIDELNNRR